MCEGGRGGCVCVCMWKKGRVVVKTWQVVYHLVSPGREMVKVSQLQVPEPVCQVHILHVL